VIPPIWLDAAGKPRPVRPCSRSGTDELGRRAEIVCSGVMPSGMLRHPLFVRWLD